MATTTRKTTTRKTSTKKAAEQPEVIEPKVGEITDDGKIAKLEALVRSQAEAIELLKKQLEAKPAAVPSIDNREKVVFLWQAPVADYNIVEFGKDGSYGRISGNRGTIMIPKQELSQVMDTRIRHYMDLRWLIVLSGLDEQEREMFGVNYKEGEYLSREAFMDVVGVGEEILDIYPKLCEAHKEMVAKFYYEAWKENRGVKRDIVVALNKISRHDAFKSIIEEMNERDASEE